MKKIIKVISIILTVILILTVNTYAKYNYNFNIKAFSLIRDNSEITYKISRTENEKEYTNKDVTLTIDLNKPIESIDEFNISEDGMRLTKLITENESKTITVEDVSGNKKEITYNINNIDKIPPQIIGVDDGETYYTSKTINYEDNIGIDNIFVDKYSNLFVQCYEDYYDTGFYKGIDVTSNTIEIEISSHTKNTRYYRYYLNGSLISQTENAHFKYINLTPGTIYTITVETVDKDGKVLETVVRNILTKYFSSIKTEKKSDSYTVTLYGLDTRIGGVVGVGYTNNSGQKVFYTNINSDRSVSITFPISQITGVLQNGYYFFHLQLYDLRLQTIYNTVCCNVIFNENYIPSKNEINPYEINYNGNYQLIATDLAGNLTEKNITIIK